MDALCLLFIFSPITFFGIEASHFRGGAITWSPTGNGYEVNCFLGFDSSEIVYNTELSFKTEISFYAWVTHESPDKIFSKMQIKVNRMIVKYVRALSGWESIPTELQFALWDCKSFHSFSWIADRSFDIDINITIPCF